MFRRGKKSPRQKQKRVKISQNDYNDDNYMSDCEYKKNLDKSLNNDSGELDDPDNQK